MADQDTKAVTIMVDKDSVPLKLSLADNTPVIVIAAVIPVIGAILGALARFGNDNRGKRLTVFGTFAFTFALLGALLPEGRIILLVAGGVSLIAGFVSCSKCIPVPKGEELPQCRYRN